MESAMESVKRAREDKHPLKYQQHLMVLADENKRLQAADEVHWKTRRTLLTERDELLEEVQNLQQALSFWLPCFGPDTHEAIAPRIEHDAYLLAGYNGFPEKSAEEHGWIVLRGGPETPG